MKPLNGRTVVALGGMAGRPLARFLESMGAAVRAGRIEDARTADFLIEDLGLRALEAEGWSRARIEAANPSLVHVSVTPFGSGNPLSEWKGGELVASAMGGPLRLTGDPDRPPVKEALDACGFHAEMVAAAGAAAAHFSRARSGKGQHVDVSVQEVAFNRNVSSIVGWQFDRRKISRAGGALNYGRASVRCIWPLADGWCFHSLMTGRFGAPANSALSRWMDDVGADNPMREVNWLEYDRSSLDPETRAVWERAIEAFFQTRTKAEIRTEGRERGINACVAAEPAEVLGDPHLKARGFWDGPDGDARPSRFVRMTSGARAPDRPVPAGPRPGPLSGLRVLDFSWALVGSITTKTLGDLGADVVKVESRTRPCLSRLDVQVSASRRGDFDDKPWFAHLNTSKRSLSLDMKRPEARELLDPLIHWADVVVENFSPGTMEKLGLGYDQLAERNPGIIMVSGSVYGQTGPMAREWGVDGTGGALSGRTFLTGWPDRDPVIPGAVPYGDVILPFAMAAAAALAAEARGRHGAGGHVDASMYELCVQQMSAAIEQAQRGPAPRRSGNDEAGIFRQTVFAAAGEDCWLAVTAWTEEDWARALDAAGGKDLADWIRRRDAREAAAILQAAGVAAAPVQDIEDLIERDPALIGRGALTLLPHPKLGDFGHVRTPVSFSGETIAAFRAPGIGEHNREIATGLAGMGEARFEELAKLGVLQ